MKAAIPASMKFVTCKPLILPINVYPVSHFKFFLDMLFMSIFIRNPFFIFHLDNQHPLQLEKRPVSIELWISLFPPFFKCPRVRPCECGCIHEDTLFTLSRLVPFNSSSDGWSNCRDAWPYFPGIKVGPN